MPSNIPLWTFGVAFRLRLVTFTEQAHRAHRPLGGISPWRRGHISALWHGDPAYRYLGGILAWRGGLLSTLWHGDPQQNHFWGRVTWQDCLDPVSNRSLADASAGLRHGIPDERPLGGIPAWRRGRLSALWHGDPQQNHFWGRVTWQDCLDPVSNRSLADASAGLRHGIPCERPLGGIPAWRGSHLSALRP